MHKLLIWQGFLLKDFDTVVNPITKNLMEEKSVSQVQMLTIYLICIHIYVIIIVFMLYYLFILFLLNHTVSII